MTNPTVHDARLADGATDGAGRTVLLVEDTSSLQMIYATILERAGWQVVTADTAASALEQFRRHRPQVVVLDLMLPDGSGMEVMRTCLADAPATRFVVITADGSIQLAVEAMRVGAHEFLVKPLDEARLTAAANDAAAAAEVEDADDRDPQLSDPARLGRAQSPVMSRLLHEIRAVSRSKATVFLNGESGTGRRTIARTIHKLSTRADKPFVVVNCGASTAPQLEAELFGGSAGDGGHDRGGAALRADGGTLLLKDVVALDCEAQAILLRFLQTSTVTQPGRPRPVKVNVRIIATSNFDPMHDDKPNRLQDELFYYLYVIPFRIPPLRERGEDILSIAEDLLAECCAEEGREMRRLDPEAREILADCHWPGNIRQMKNVLRRVVLLNDGPEVTADMLPQDLMPPLRTDAESGAASSVGSLVGQTLAEIERHVIEETIRQTRGSLPRAARILGVAPSTLYRKREAWQDGGTSAQDAGDAKGTDKVSTSD